MTEDEDLTWLRLYRKIIKSQVFCDPFVLKVWVWCLAKAAYREHWLTMPTGRGNTTVHLKAGEFVFGRISASKELKMPAKSAENRMKKLRDMGNLAMQPGDHFTIVTVCKWAELQPEADNLAHQWPGNGPPMARQWPGNGHKQEGKEGKEGVESKEQEEEDRSGVKPDPPAPKLRFDFNDRQWHDITPEDRRLWLEAYPAVNLDVELAKAANWCLNAGAKGHKKQWGAFLARWFSKAQDNGGGSRAPPGGYKTRRERDQEILELWRQQEAKEKASGTGEGGTAGTPG